MTTEQATNTSWFKTLLLVAAIILGIGYLFRFFTPQQVAVQPLLDKNIYGDKTNFAGVTFTGNVPLVPDKLPIAQAKNLLSSEVQIENKLVAYFKLKKLPDVENVWMGPQYSLTKSLNENLYTVTAEGQIPEQIVLDPQKAVAQAQTIIAELIPENNYQLLEDQIEYLDEHSYEDESVKPEDAVLIKVPFGYRMGIYPVFYDKYQQRSVEVFINARYELQRITISPFTATITLEQSIETVPVSQAIANINNGYGSIIGVVYEEFGNPSLASINSGKMNSVNIEYRIDPTTQAVLPYYRFVGELTNTENQTFSAEVITPAIQTNFDQP